MCIRDRALKEYVGYIGGRIGLDDWVESATEKVAAIRKIETQSEMYQLLQAHIYVIGKKMEEAKWILENYNYNRDVYKRQGIHKSSFQ